MKTIRFTLSVIAVIGCLPITASMVSASPAATSKTTANMTFHALAKAKGSLVMSRVVGIAGFYGQDQPQQWLVLATDRKVPNLLHEFALRDGKLVAERHFTRQPELDIPSIPIPLSLVRIDSNQVFRIAETTARRAGVGFDSIHYQLRCRDLRNEPIWVLNLVDQVGNTVGVHYISAVTGETLRVVWHRPGTPDYTSANQDGTGIVTKIGKGLNGAGKSISNASRKVARKSKQGKAQMATNVQSRPPAPQQRNYYPPPR